MREDLEELVGPVEKITREEDIHLKIELPLKGPAARGVVPRVPRERMQALKMEPQFDPKGPPFYAKLRAEGDANLLKTGEGKLYFGFHLDPFLQAHWNNLTPPLQFKLEVTEGVKVAKLTGEAPKVEAVSDADPREFLLDVESWPEDKPIRLTVTYSACIEDKSCHVVTQSYVLHRQRDNDGGGARGEGAGYWGAEFVRQQMNRDKDKDGKLSKDEVMGLVRPHFEKLDTNKDGFLDAEELKPVVEWLNHNHQPGTPPPRPKD